MNHDQFHIGLDFWCGGNRWRCTDVGSRVIVAISLEPHEVISIDVDPHDRSKRSERRYMTDDPSWLNGPPYGIVEHVFDEDSIVGCSVTPEADDAAWTLDDLDTLLKDADFDIELHFKALHHFSKHPPFKTAPSRFAVFVDYCKSRTEGIEDQGENKRTIQRTYAFVLLTRKHSVEESMAMAWRAFPLVKLHL